MTIDLLPLGTHTVGSLLTEHATDHPKDPFLVHNIEVDEEDNLAVMLDQDLPSGFACRPGYLAVLYLGSAAIDWIPVSESVTPVEVEVHYTRP